MAAHQQVGDFEAVNVNGRIKKNGGNVASYFCTPSGRVIHAIVGPARAEQLLAAAQWAVDTYESVQGKSLSAQQQHVAKAHAAAIGMSLDAMQGKWNHHGSREQRVHQLLAMQPLPPLEHVYEEIFGKILGQKISKAGPNLVMAQRQLQLAESTQRPLLMVFHKQHDNSSAMEQWSNRLKECNKRGLPLDQLVRQYIVIMMPLKELPALSRQLGQPPYLSNGHGSPLFVIARPNGEQLASVTGWNNEIMLAQYLADTYMVYLSEHANSIGELRIAQRILGKLDTRYVEPLRDMILRMTAARAAARDANPTPAG